MPRGRSRYLRDRASRMRRSDYRNGMDYRNDMSESYSNGYYRENQDRHYYQEPYMVSERYREPKRMYDYDMRRDYRDYRYEKYDRYEDEYQKDLEEWINKLKKYDRFGMNKAEVIQKAKEMGVSFKDYDEEEYYAIYLMHISDYPQVANEPHTYLAMAKAWLEDKDLEIEPSEKVCKYLYEIVMAEE